jgi:hypothetical protein
MDSSEGVKIPLVRGIDRTLRVVGGGGEESSHADGIRDWRSCCLRWAIARQGAGGGGVMVELDTLCVLDILQCRIYLPEKTWLIELGMRG